MITFSLKELEQELEDRLIRIKRLKNDLNILKAEVTIIDNLIQTRRDNGSDYKETIYGKRI